MRVSRGTWVAVAVAGAFAVSTAVPLAAWGPQGHRVIARVAWNHLSVPARHEVQRLLDGATLAGISTWADDIREQQPETGAWHFVNMPAGAARYERDRDCPRPAPGRDEGWRDCVVDRIEQARRQMADRTAPREVRARALKLLVHFVGDLHQPFHAIGVGRGGNTITVAVPDTVDCGPDGRGGRRGCTLHGIWDSVLLSRRRMGDDALAQRLERAIRSNQWRAGAGGPEAWALESMRLAEQALVPNGAAIGHEYFRRFDRGLDEQLARAGLRLAATINGLSLEP